MSLKISTKFEEALHRQIAGFIIDDDNRQVIEDIKKYLDREEGPLHPDKGLLIMGNPGSGKTEMMKAIQSVYRDYFHPFSFRMGIIEDIGIEFTKKDVGYLCLPKYESGHWFLDELCWHSATGRREKEIVSNYANRDIDIGTVIINKRYLQFDRGFLTHFTTNANLETLETEYSETVISRLKKMCNFIVLIGPDRRGTAEIKSKMPVVEINQKPTEEMKKESELQVIKDMIIAPYQAFLNNGYLKLSFPEFIYDVLKKRKILNLSEKRVYEFYEAATKKAIAIYKDDKQFRESVKEKGDYSERKIINLGKKLAVENFLTECRDAEINIEELILSENEKSGNTAKAK